MSPDTITRAARLLMLTPALLFSAALQALPDDWQQEVVVLSDKAEMDRRSGIVIYNGNVILTQGSMKIEADRLTVFRAGNTLEKAIAEGQPARYQQQVTAGKPLTRAEGSRIDYLAGKREVTVTGNARLEQDGNLFSGETILYDMTRETVSARGGKPSSGEQSGSQPERIRMVIQPQAVNPDNGSEQTQEQP
ncbi:MAG: lipopolysaccharide transport periplasmic protein LptA [Pseudomonadota bacterium]|nr:lipopolysaccharide transport periplasmic protein LptA [Pseudomonadota bacterium]